MIELTDDLKRQAASIWMHRAQVAEARNAKLVAALKAVTALDESGSYVARMEWRLRKETEAAITENEK